MAKIKKIKEGTATVYPATIPQAVIDPTSGKSVRTELNEKEAVANKKQTVTNSATDYPSGAAVTASLALKTDISELNKVYPLYNYNVRVGADSGSIGNVEKLTKLYNENLALLDSTVFLWSGVAGMKTRTSGSNIFASKLYNMANKVQQFGAELVTNGTFTTNTTGWSSVAGAELLVDTNRLKVTVGSAFGGASQIVTTIIGKRYHFTASYVRGNADARMAVGTTITGRELCDTGVLTTDKTVTLSFVATTTTSYIYISNASANIGDYVFFDNISIKQMDWVEGTNDAIQTTGANQPYVGGLIAPNEAAKLKFMGSNLTKIPFTPVILSPNSNFTLSVCVKFYKIGDYTQTPLFPDRGSSGLYISNDSQRLYGFRFHDTDFRDFSFGVSSIPYRNKYVAISMTKVGDVLSLYINGELKSSITTTTSTTNFEFYNFPYSGAASIQGLMDISYYTLHSRALSASEIQAQHDYLRLQIPEIEGIAIGNQYWTTSNYEGVVAGDGSVIPEVQAAANVNTMTNGDFVSSDISAWTNRTRCTMTWNVGEYVEVVSTGTGDFAIGRGAMLTDYQNKWHKITFRAKSPNSTDVPKLLQTTHYTNILWVKRPALSTSWQEYEVLAYAFNAANTIFYPVSSGAIIGTQVDIDDIVDQTVGWSGATALYDAIYAQTSGTAAAKELAALKAAAMWCYYNNDVNNGAIYGKLYNWYAVKLISLYPPQGWRVPTSADFTQLSNYLGGSTVAGGKIKKEGLAYWASPNTGATNESGLSLIPNGYRSIVGVFTSQTTRSAAWGVDIAPVLVAPAIVTYASDATINLASNDNKLQGFGLRLLRNSPVGPNERMETSGVFDTNIASTAKQVPISFGYTVDCIRITNLQPSGGTNLTNVEAKLHNASGTAIATLITGKTVNVASTMVYNISAEHAAMLQDGTIRVTATGNLSPGMIIEVVLKKATF